MKKINIILLFAALIIITIGNFSSDVRPIFFCIGFTIIIIIYLCERFFLKNVSYNVNELIKRRIFIGEFSAIDTDFIFTDKWNLNNSKRISKLNGDYKIEIVELYKENFSLISEIIFECTTEFLGEKKSGSVRVHIDTGFIIFLQYSYLEYFTPRELEKLIQDSLRRLPNNKPLCLCLKNKDEKIVGIVISTGEGDGTYSVTYQKKDEVLVKIYARFIRSKGNINVDQG